MKRVATLLVLLTLLAGCTPPPSDVPPTPAPLHVVRYIELKVYDPVYVGVDQGLCAKRGIDVQIQGAVLGGPTAIQAVASGSAEAGLSSVPALINAAAAGLPVIGVSDFQSALPGQPLEEYFVRSDSGITSIEQLPGKKFAVNLLKSSFQYTAFMTLEQHGLKDDAVDFILLPFANQAEALMHGDVDVIGLIEPYASQAKAIYGDKITKLFDAADVFGTKQFTLSFVNSVWAKDHPKEAAAFVGCLIDSINWIEANEDQARQIEAAHTKVDARYVPAYHYQKNGVVVMGDVQFWLDYMVKRGDVTVSWLKAENVATNQYQP